MRSRLSAALILSALMSIAGLFALSEATLGVGLICGACYLGIIARIVQADGEKKR